MKAFHSNAADAAPLLACSQLAKAFGAVTSLSGVTLSFSEPEVVAIIGPNGAGKTTLLNVITGFIRPDSGKVVIRGHDATGLSVESIARLGVVRTFQDLKLISALSALENVMLCQHNPGGETIAGIFRRGRLRLTEGQIRRDAMRWIEFTGLKEVKDALAGALSYGDQKLLAFACALASNANILLLDEPLAGADLEIRSRFSSLMIALKRLGKLVVFVEHDLVTVQSAADRVVVLQEGLVLADGPPGEIMRRPEIIRAFIGSATPRPESSHHE